MTFKETARVMSVIRAWRKVERALALETRKLGEYDEELHKAARVYLELRRRENAAQETPDRKEGESMAQKENTSVSPESIAVSAELPKIEGIAETEEKKGWTEMTQEKYKKVALAMQKALVSIFGDHADVEDRLRTADAEIQSVLLHERICARPASYPIEGIAVEAEKLETEDEADEDEAKKLTRAAVLEKARACVCGEREEDYGSPEDNFGCIAELWEAYLRAACVSPNAIIKVTPTDVAMLMALLKIARVGTSFVGGTADSFVDLAGYAACGAECADVEASSDDA